MNIYEKLASISDRDWVTYINAEIHSKELEHMTSTKKYNEKFELLLKDIIPKKLEVFNMLKDYELKNSADSFLKDTYDIGIFLVGFSETPVILSLSALDVENYYFICTEDSVDTLKNRVKTAIESNNLSRYFCKEKKVRIIEAINSEKRTKVVKNESDITAEIFAYVKEIVQECNEDDKIVFDITCGKKTMSSASFVFGTIYGRVKMVYIDYEEYLQNEILGLIPRSGTEFMYSVVNLDKIFRFSDFKNINKLMKSHQYDAAYTIVETMFKAVEERNNFGIDFQSEKEELIKLKNTLDFYKKWDEYDYNEAISVYRRNEGSILFDEKIIDLFGSYPKVDVEKLNRNNFQKILRGKMIDVASNEETCPYVLIDRYCNALRKYESGDYLDCVIRLSSIIELGTYYYIIKKCDGTKDGIFEDGKYFTKDDIRKHLKENYTLQNVLARMRLICEGKYKKNHKGGIKSYIFGSKIKCDPNNLKDITEERNQLSIVHGVLHGSSKEVKNSDNEKRIKEFIIEICEITEDEFNSIKDKLTFKRLSKICDNISVYLKSV